MANIDINEVKFLKKYLAKDGTLLCLVDDEIKSAYPELCSIAIQTNYNAIKYIQPSILASHPDMCVEVAKTIVKNYEQDPIDAYERQSKSWRWQFKDDSDFYFDLDRIEAYIGTYDYDTLYLDDYINDMYNTFEKISKALENQPEKWKEILKVSSTFARFTPPEVLNTPEICKIIMESPKPQIIQYISNVNNELATEVIADSIAQHPSILDELSENIQTKLYESGTLTKIIERNPLAIKYVPDSILKVHPEIKEYINQDTKAISDMVDSIVNEKNEGPQCTAKDVKDEKAIEE